MPTPQIINTINSVIKAYEAFIITILKFKFLYYKKIKYKQQDEISINCLLI